MGGLTRTDLTTSQKIKLARSALGLQGVHGAITGLSTEFEVSRPTVYRAREEAHAALMGCFAPAEKGPAGAIVRADEAQIRRAVVALRVVAPNSIRAIETLLPILYPGVQWSFGSIQAVAAEAEENAKQFNVQTDLSAIVATALDEMFSQGSPVLAGVDLDSGTLFALSLRASRSAETWAEVLQAGQKQGLNPRCVVKDAAGGIAAGVEAVFPKAEQRDDCFHALYEMGKVRQILERAAFGAMTAEWEAAQRLRKAIGRITPSSEEMLRSLRVQLSAAQRNCQRKMALHDEFEREAERAHEAMELVDLKSGTLREPAWMQAEIEAAASRLRTLDHPRCAKVGRYVFNRAPGLVRYAVELKQVLHSLDDRFGKDPVAMACVAWRLIQDLREGRRPWQRHRDHQHLLGTFAWLNRQPDTDTEALLSAVDEAFRRRHRASSAIEGFNAALRPFLYIHKGVTQSFLELFRAYYNQRMRRWGRHKGTSPQEILSGKPAGDWLSELGFPPSSTLN